MYDPSQPRDIGGEWTSGGGGSALDPDTEAEAYRKFDSPGSIDPGLTNIYPNPAQAWSIESYQSATYLDVNSGLRNGVPLKGFDLRTQEGLDSLFKDGAKLPENLTLYRGVDASGEDIFTNLKPGDSITDKGFMSTSMLSKVASDFQGAGNVSVMKILAPKGSSAATISLATDSFNQENEVLLQRGTKLNYIGRDKKGFNVFKVAA